MVIQQTMRELHDRSQINLVRPVYYHIHCMNMYICTFTHVFFLPDHTIEYNIWMDGILSPPRAQLCRTFCYSKTFCISPWNMTPYRRSSHIRFQEAKGHHFHFEQVLPARSFDRSGIERGLPFNGYIVLRKTPGLFTSTVKVRILLFPASLELLA